MTSTTLQKISFEAASLFLWLIPLPDDHGCCLLTSSYVKGRVFYSRPEVTEDMIGHWIAELEQVDLLRTWVDDSNIYAKITNWEKHQRIRSFHQRKTPPPPSFGRDSPRVAASRRRSPRLAGNNGLNLNLNPNLNLNVTNVTKIEKETKEENGNGEVFTEGKPEVRSLLLFFSSEFVKKHSGPYNIQWGKDGKIMKDLIAVYGVEKLKELISAFFASNDMWIRQVGHSVGILSSTANKLLISLSDSNAGSPAEIEAMQWEKDRQRMNREREEKKLLANNGGSNGSDA